MSGMSLIDCCAGLSLSRLLTHRDQKLSEALKKQLEQSQKKNGDQQVLPQHVTTSGKPKDYRQSKLKSPKRRKLRADDRPTSSASSRNNDSIGSESIQEQISEIRDADSAVSVVSTAVSHQSSAASVPPEEHISEEVQESSSSSRIKTERSPGGLLGHASFATSPGGLLGHASSATSKVPTEYSQDMFESLDSTLTSVRTHPTPPLGTSTPFKISPNNKPPGGIPHVGAPEEDYSLSENRTESISGEL